MISQRDAEIVALRDAGATYKVIAAKYDISKERTRQIILEVKRQRARPPHWSDALTVRLRNRLWVSLGGPEVFNLPEHEAVDVIAAHSQLFYLRQPDFGRQCLNQLMYWLARFDRQLPYELTETEIDALGLRGLAHYRTSVTR